ncbi:cytochrome c oxidase subunit II [Rheinheimera sp.]|uniref:cytochrome c oxidase subunit II n=1 Tax=Rheinheimera sp. TaxID=1869214 RepID=UPI0027347F94|nr:cytochrome c oxidase subunit II [Rheinheimera sp.]MDP2714726.1 cytochrome c oxidase subunit II [Rheinheimera sp.]
MAIIIVLVLLVLGSVAFHFISPWWFTPIASNWQSIDTTINITFWVTGFVFVAVNLFLAYAVFRYRFNKDRSAAYQPENKKLEAWLTLFTTVGIVAMLAPGLYVWGQFVEVPDDATEVEAVGQQWHWSFRLPGEDGKLGEVDPRLVSEANPFGINPADPAGQDDILVQSNELVLPLDKPVKVLLRSKDVLHNFAVPQFRVKMDLVPGMVTYLWFTPTREGRFDIMCEELCGVAHFAMRGKVRVTAEAEYQQWLAAQPTFAQSQNRYAGDAELGRAMYQVCAACHGANGEGNSQLNAPALAGQSRWYLKRQLQHYQQGIRGSNEADLYGAQMVAMANMLQDEQTQANVLSFIDSLPAPEIKRADGDMQRGRALYRNCGYCHGSRAQGIYAMNAPALTALDATYLRRQLDYFKQGVRGSHSADFYGAQMQLMAQSLHSEQDYAAIIAYISSLSNTAGSDAATLRSAP